MQRRPQQVKAVAEHGGEWELEEQEYGQEKLLMVLAFL